MKARVADIIVLAARLTNMKPGDITKRSRAQRVVRIRAAVAIVARKHDHSYPVIAHRVGLSDHTSVMNYIRNEDIWRKQFPEFGQLVDRLTEEAEKPESFFLGEALPMPALPAKPKRVIFEVLQKIECPIIDPDQGHLMQTAVANGSIRLAHALKQAMAA